MHKSRIGEITIDCQTDDLTEAVEFWTAALGLKAKRYDESIITGYALETAPNEIDINLQAVDHPSRVHIDIETDDIEAEVARLEKLGAKKLRKGARWWVMEAPTGHRFCVVGISRANFDKEAQVWE